MALKKTRKKHLRIGSVQQKILLLLLGGVALACSRSPRAVWKVVEAIHHDWKEIDRQSLERAIKRLYESKLIGTKGNRDGTVTMILNENGKRIALTYDLENMRVKKPARWDGKWRIVTFDVPERIKKVREALRMHLRDLGMHELQKSIFIHPFDCRNELEYIIEHYDARKYIRFIIADSIDNELELKKHFSLSR